MPCGVSVVRHVHEELFPPADKLSYLSVSRDLVIAASPSRKDVIFLELRNVLDEPICTEDRYVVEPVITRRSGEHNPSVSCGNLIERLDPCSGSNQSLFVEDEERILNSLVLFDVLP